MLILATRGPKMDAITRKQIITHKIVILRHRVLNEMSNYRFSGSTNSHLASNQLYNLLNIIWRQYDEAKKVGHYQIFLKSPYFRYFLI